MDLPPITRAAFYASLGPPRKLGRWTRQTALIALGLYVREEGRLPPQRHLHNHECMPSYDTVLALFGTVPKYLTALPAAWMPEVPAQAPIIPRTPAHYAKQKPQSEEVECLRCESPWPSPDKINRRICPACTYQEHDDSGDWMNGEPVVHTGWDVDVWEDNNNVD